MRAVALLSSVGRLIFGVVFIAHPKLMEPAWIGKQARLPGAQLLARAVGARDLALGLGALRALLRDDRDRAAPPWLAAAAICDGVDFGATLAAGSSIPREARNGVLVVAPVFGLLSAASAVAVSRDGPAKPAEADAANRT